MSDGVLFKGNMEEGSYRLIKTTDGWVLVGKDIVFAGSDITDRPQGEWINQDKGAFYPIECSVCHTPPPCDEEDYFLTNFCPNCGADMRGKGDEHSDFR